MLAHYLTHDLMILVTAIKIFTKSIALSEHDKSDVFINAFFKEKYININPPCLSWQSVRQVNQRPFEPSWRRTVLQVISIHKNLSSFNSMKWEEKRWFHHCMNVDNNVTQTIRFYFITIKISEGKQKTTFTRKKEKSR